MTLYLHIDFTWILSNRGVLYIFDDLIRRVDKPVEP
jgi:hypothetical protein